MTTAKETPVNPGANDRVIRVFISSTFRDMHVGMESFKLVGKTR